jgi:uncharacterized protein (DUF58 family)
MAIQTAHDLLDPTVIARAEMLGLHARQLVEGYMAGEHKSPFHGFATEFSQHREYVPGDDLRHLDWKVLGRTDRLHLKQYEQETNFVAHLLLDGSESMKYGSTRLNKLQYGKVMAACLAYLILLQRDAVALNLFDTRIREHLPRTDNRAAIHNLMRVLADFQPTEPTNIAQILHNLAGQVRRRGIAIIISDLFDDEEKILQGIQHLRFVGHEVIVFHVLDPAELEFPFKGTVEFIGLENIPKMLTRPRELRKTYLREFEQFCTRLRVGCEHNNTHYVQVNTDHTIHEVLSGYLAFRLRMGRSRH